MSNKEGSARSHELHKDLNSSSNDYDANKSKGIDAQDFDTEVLHDQLSDTTFN